MGEEASDAYDPSAYSFMIMLMCTSEEEVATAMERLNLVLVGLALQGINVMMMRPPTDHGS